MRQGAWLASPAPPRTQAKHARGTNTHRRNHRLVAEIALVVGMPAEHVVAVSVPVRQHIVEAQLQSGTYL